MFFVLSKTIDFLAMPYTWVIGLVVAAVIVKNTRRKQQLIVGAMVLLLFFSNDFIANEVMEAWEMETVAYDQLRPHALGIVLTGATIPNREPRDRVYFARGADRVIHTVELYKRGLIKKILVSGGSGLIAAEEEPEADKFKRAMVLMGVPETDILLENQTRNTRESAQAVKPMLDSLQVSSTDCLLITSAFHMRRSLACYHKAGLIPLPFTTDFYTHPRSYYPDSLLEPSFHAMMVWQKLAKEWVGLLAYKVAGYC